MKSHIYFIIFCYLCTIQVSCNGKKGNPSLIINIDVNQKYPIKEISLAEIAEMEFIILEANENYLYKGQPRIVTEKWIIFHNFPEGDIIIYNRMGKPCQHFSRQGNGPEEYLMSGNIAFDEDLEEIYVFSIDNYICSYKLDGTFLNKIPLPDQTFIQSLANYDKNHFLYYNTGDKEKPSFVLISKQKGEVVKEIFFPIEKKLNLWERVTDGEIKMAISSYADYIVNHKDGFLLNEFSYDTVFLYNRNYELTPILTRTPPVQGMNPMIYLNSFMETSEYLFLTSTKKLFDAEKKGFPETGLIIEKKTRKIYEQQVKWDDYKGKTWLLGPHIIAQTSQSNTGLLFLSGDKLRDDYEENLLDSRLKKVVANMDTENNDLLLLLHFK